MTIKAVNSLGLSNETGPTSSVDSVLYLEPSSANLGTITSVTTGIGPVQFIDFAFISFQNELTFQGCTAETEAALLTFAAGDTLVLGYQGSEPWVTVSSVVSQGNGDVVVYFSASSPSYPFSTATPAKLGGWDVNMWGPYPYFVADGSSTFLHTDNPGLALSQDYFEIGGTVVSAAAVTVAGGALSLTGDHTASYSVGMSVVEKSYPGADVATVPEVREYDVTTGQWVSHVDAAVYGPVTMLATNWRSDYNYAQSVTSGTDYVFGMVDIFIPPDWEEWVIEAFYYFEAQSQDASGAQLCRSELRFVLNPTVNLPYPKSYAYSGSYSYSNGYFKTFSTTDFPDTPQVLSRGYGFAGAGSTSNKQVLSANYGRLNIPWGSSMADVTRVGIYCWVDPSFTSGWLYKPEATVMARRVK